MAGPSLFRPDSISSGLQGYWKLDETSGTRADSSGNSNTLTDNNTVASLTQDYFASGEKSADFESGNTEYLSIVNGSQTGLDITGAFSFCAWIKLESVGANQMIMQRNSGSAGYGLIVTSGNVLSASVNATTWVTSATTLTANRWYHVAVVYNQSNAIIYIDGNLDTIAATTADPSTNTGTFCLGAESTPTNYFDGLMKDAAVWNVAITAIQVKSLAFGVDLSTYSYRPDHSDLSSGLVSYWKLNEAGADATNYNATDSKGSNTLSSFNGTRSRGGFVEGIGRNFVGNPHGSAMDYLSITHASQSGLDQDSASAEIGISLWFKADTLESTDVLVHKYNGGDGFHIEVNSGGTIQFTIGRTTNTNLTTSSGVITSGVWYHLVCTYNASNDTMYIYLDGEEVATASHTYGIGDAGTDFFVGSNGSASGNDYFSGTISDLAIWTREITATEAAMLAKAFDWQQTGLVSHWKMDESSGTRVDAMGNNDLTDNNTVTSGTGKKNNSASFDDANSEYLSIADASQTDLDNDGTYAGITVLAWAKPHDVTGQNVLFCKGSAVTASGGYSFYFDGANNFIMYNDGTTTSDPANPAVDTWYHCGIVIDGAKDYIYVDSYNAASTANAAGAGNADPFTFGCYGAGGGSFLDGEVDEAIYLKRPMRPEEIKVVYTRGLAGDFATVEVAGGDDGGGSFCAAA